MPLADVVTDIELDKILRVSTRRILACRPTVADFKLEVASRVTVSLSEARHIVAIVREAILNSIDFAHPAGVWGKITVTSARRADGSVQVEIADDGVGLPEDFDPLVDGSRGFDTMRAASAELGAVLSFISTCLGLTIILALPRPAARERSALAA